MRRSNLLSDAQRDGAPLSWEVVEPVEEGEVASQLIPIDPRMWVPKMNESNIKRARLPEGYLLSRGWDFQDGGSKTSTSLPTVSQLSPVPRMWMRAEKDENEQGILTQCILVGSLDPNLQTHHHTPTFFDHISPVALDDFASDFLVLPVR